MRSTKPILPRKVVDESVFLKSVPDPRPMITPAQNSTAPSTCSSSFIEALKC